MGNLSIGGSNFDIVYSTCPTAPAPLLSNQECQIGVQFTPLASGQLGTSIIVDYGISPSDTTEFNSAIGVNGRAFGQLTFAGLQSISNISHKSLTLNWNATTDALSFMIYEIDGTSPVYLQTVTNASGTEDSLVIDGLDPNSSYTYRVRGVDMFGVFDSNTVDLTATTLPNTAPQIDRSTIAVSGNVYETESVATINFNDVSFGNDFDFDGDVVAYTCKYDNVVDGSVAPLADDCSTIINEDGSNVTFSSSTGIFASWLPRIADSGTTFEFKVVAQDFYGDSDTYIFTRTVLPLPQITNITARTFPSNPIVQGDTFSVDIDNVRPTVPDDIGMTYTCSYVQNYYTATVASGSCDSLPGNASLDANGLFTWVTDTTTHGSFDLTFIGTDANGKSDTEIRRFNVRPAYQSNNLIVNFDASFANLTEPANNGTSFTNTFKNLLASAGDGGLSNFDTAASWQGDNSPALTNHLKFDGVDDFISAGNDLDAASDLVFTTWVSPNGAGREKVIFSNGDSSLHGITLTTDRLVIGDMNYTGYDATIAADNPDAP